MRDRDDADATRAPTAGAPNRDPGSNDPHGSPSDRAAPASGADGPARDGAAPARSDDGLSLDRLARLIDIVTTPVTVQAADGRVVFANEAAARATGVPSSAAVLRSAATLADGYDLFDELNRPVAPDDLPGRVALRTGRSHALTLRFRPRRRRPAAVDRWATVSAVPLLDAGGRAEYAVTIVHDITDAKRLEAELRVRDARSRLLADATRDLDESLDPAATVRRAMAAVVPSFADWAALDLIQADGTFERVAVDVADPGLATAAAALRAYPVRPGDGHVGTRAIAERRAIITRLDGHGPALDPDRPGLMDVLRRLGTTCTLAVPLIARDLVEGVLILASCNDSRRYDEADAEYVADLGRRIALAVGNARLYAAAQRERTAVEAEANRAEQLLAELEVQSTLVSEVVRNLPDGVIVADAGTGRTLIVNEALVEILGRERPRDADVWDRIRRAERPDGTPITAAEWPVARAIATGRPVPDEELRVVRRDGGELWVTVRAAPIVDANGHGVAVVAVVRDVTAEREDRRRAELLAEVGMILGSPIDPSTMMEVADLVVPAIADACAVDLVSDGGGIDRIASAGLEALPADVEARIDSAVAATLRDAGKRYASGRRLDDGAGVGQAPGSRHRSWRGGQLITVPLVADGAPAGVAIGAITLVAGPSRKLGEPELAFARELAIRSAAAIQTSRLFREAVRFRSIVDAVRDGVTLNDPASFRVTYANDAVLEQLGRPRAAVVGHPMPEWTEGMSLDELRSFVAPIIAGKVSSRSIDLVRVRPDGSRVPVEIGWQVVDLPGIGPQLVTISRSIEERIATQRQLADLVRAEHARAAELNAIIGAIGDGVVVLDGTGRIILVNPTARALVAPLERWTVDELVEQFEDPDGRVRAAFIDPASPGTFRLLQPAGRWVEVSSYAIEGSAPAEDSATASERIVLLRDVTVARGREAVRDAFVGILSHELRTPVTTILAGTKVLARDSPTLDGATRRDIFEDIHAEAERLHRLVEDVVAITRFGEGALEIGSEPVLVQRILPSIVQTERARWPVVRFELDIEPSLPPVAGDPTYVEQVVRNLLANAVKYGGPDSVVEVVARAADDDVEVRVLDRGPGFPAEEASRLFDLFYRSPATAGSASGSGIGLFVCARLLDAMGGRIWASNRHGGGAEFGFALQVVRE